LIDSSLAPPDDILGLDDAPPAEGSTYPVGPRSVVVLWALRADTAGALPPSSETMEAS